MSNVNVDNIVNGLNTKKKAIQKRKDAIVGAKSQLVVFKKNEVEYTGNLNELGVMDVSDEGIAKAIDGYDKAIDEQVNKINALFQDLNNV